MFRGFILFKCTECKRRFLGPDIELAGTVLTMPVECPKCGSMRTRSSKLFGGSDQLYEKFWDNIHKEDK